MKRPPWCRRRDETNSPHARRVFVKQGGDPRVVISRRAAATGETFDLCQSPMTERWCGLGVDRAQTRYTSQLARAQVVQIIIGEMARRPDDCRIAPECGISVAPAPRPRN